MNQKFVHKLVKLKRDLFRVDIENIKFRRAKDGSLRKPIIKISEHSSKSSAGEMFYVLYIGKIQGAGTVHYPIFLDLKLLKTFTANHAISGMDLFKIYFDVVS